MPCELKHINFALIFEHSSNNIYSSSLIFSPSCFEQSPKPAGSAMKDSINVNDFQTVTRFEVDYFFFIILILNKNLTGTICCIRTNISIFHF